MHGVLVVDKPEGLTSHDVVRTARRAFGTRAVGHAGTLDPRATGVLVLGVGEGTKLLAHLTADDKAYAAKVRLGVSTDTLDAAGQVTAARAVPAGLDRVRVQAVADRFLGETLQRAPEISAIKQAGQRLYARVRRGEVVVPPERRVVVRELVIDAVEGESITLRVACGKGFYVRALARDLAAALDTVGHLTALRRVASGAFTLDGALAFERLEAASRGESVAREEVTAKLLSLAAAVARFPRVILTVEGAEDARHGRVIARERLTGEAPAVGVEPIAMLDGAGALLALGRSAEGGMHVIRGFSPH